MFINILQFSLNSILRLGKENLGTPPGIDFLPDLDSPPEIGVVSISTIDYSKEGVEQNSYETIEDLLKSEKPDWAACRWTRLRRQCR